MIAQTVREKLTFAHRRLRDLDTLIEQNHLAADPDARHQLTQEFFFHLIGAIEYLAQLVNEQRALGLVPEDVAMHKVIRALESCAPSDSLVSTLKHLSPNTRKPRPLDPYSAEGLTWRAVNYRNTVAHRGINPFHFVMSAGPKVAFFWLDPANPGERSTTPVDVELKGMLSVIEERCHEALGLL